MTTIDLGDVRYEASITGEGPAVLLLHGFTGSSADWAPFAPAVGASHTAVALDLLGHGASSRPTDPGRYALERQSDDVAAVADDLGLAPAVIVAYSYGCRIALRLAVDHPELVAGLALESPSAGIADLAERGIRRAADEALADDLERDGIDPFVRRWAAQPLFAAEQRLPAAVRDDLERRRRANDPAALAAALRGAGQGAMAPLHTRLAEIRVSTAVLAGGCDETGLVRAHIVAAGIPEAALAVFDDLGHAPHREDPTRFAAWLATALDRIVAPSVPVGAPAVVPSSPLRRSP